jgi:hypothetical protein
MSSKVEIAPEELDRLVDEGKEDVLQYFDLDNLRRGDSKRINLDLPIRFLAALDREAGLRGVTRQSLIKVWLYERLIPAVRVRTSSEIETQPGFPEVQGTAKLSSGVITNEAGTLNVVAHHSGPVKKKRPDVSTRSK